MHSVQSTASYNASGLKSYCSTPRILHNSASLPHLIIEYSQHNIGNSIPGIFIDRKVANFSVNPIWQKSTDSYAEAFLCQCRLVALHQSFLITMKVPELTFIQTSLHYISYKKTRPCRGVARFYGMGVLMYAHAKCAHKFWPHPLTKWKGRSSNYHRERILNVPNKLESRFLTEFWDKISFWLSSKLYFFYRLVADYLG